MQMRELKDGFGGSLTVWDYNGYYLPPLPVDTIATEFPNIPRWKGRDDDVYLCNFPRSGTHWLWEVLNMIIAEKAERVESVKQELMLESMGESYFNRLPSPRIINTHLYFNQLPDSIKKKRCKIVLCLRNPKDAMVSCFHLHSHLKFFKFTGTWEHYMERFINGQIDYGSWFDYTLGWEKVIKENPDVPIHIVHYEDMKSNGIHEIEKLAKFLEKKTDEQLFKDINTLCQFDKMKAEKNQGFAQSWVNDTPGFFRKGEVGDWKNWFTVAQNEYFDKIYAEKMEGSNIKMKFTLL